MQVLSTHVFIYSKMMRHTTKTAFWLILGTNILASHHIFSAYFRIFVVRVVFGCFWESGTFMIWVVFAWERETGPGPLVFNVQALGRFALLW